MVAEDDAWRAMCKTVQQACSNALTDQLDAMNIIQDHVSSGSALIEPMSLSATDRGSIVMLEENPGPHNADMRAPWVSALTHLLGDTPTWKRKGDKFMRSVCEWQLHLTRVAWVKKRAALDDSVYRVSRGDYAWRALKRVKSISQAAERERLVRNLFQDYQRFSLNPTGRTYVQSKNKPGEGGTSIAADIGEAAELEALLRLKSYLVERSDAGAQEAPASARLAQSKQKIVLGRDSTLCDVVAPFAHVSKAHATLHFLPEEGHDNPSLLYIEDKSTNGTWVNDVRIARETKVRLNHGDAFAFKEVVSGAYPVYTVSAVTEMPRESTAAAKETAASSGSHESLEQVIAPPPPATEKLQEIAKRRAFIASLHAKWKAKAAAKKRGRS